MVRKATHRKDALLAACRLSGQRVEDWATAQGVTKGHLYAVLRGERESQTLSDKIDAFIATQLPNVKVRAA